MICGKSAVPRALPEPGDNRDLDHRNGVIVRQRALSCYLHILGLKDGAVKENQTTTLSPARYGLAIGFTLLMLGAASAQEEKYNNISTPAQRAACRPDVFRFCAGEIPNVARITACMRRNKANLSDACKALIDQ
jgi:hypothetical protein